MEKEDIAKIHEAIHQNKPFVMIKGNSYPLSVSRNNNCKFIQVGDIKFMEQNPKTGSQYAQMANQGHKITWGIEDKYGYLYRIIDDKVDTLR